MKNVKESPGIESTKRFGRYLNFHQSLAASAVAKRSKSGRGDRLEELVLGSIHAASAGQSSKVAIDSMNLFRIHTKSSVTCRPVLHRQTIGWVEKMCVITELS